MGITREEIKNLLKEVIEPLERKLDNLNNGFPELKSLVDFVNGKYDDAPISKTFETLFEPLTASLEINSISIL